MKYVLCKGISGTLKLAYITLILLFSFLKKLYLCIHFVAAHQNKICRKLGILSLSIGELVVFKHLQVLFVVGPVCSAVCGPACLTIWQCAPGFQWLIQMDLQPAQSYPAGTHCNPCRDYSSSFFLGHVLFIPQCPPWFLCVFDAFVVRYQV